MTEMIKRWNGISKRTDNMTFTIHYDDGTSAEVKDGVLFTVNDSDTMDVHVGVGKKWQLFGVYLSFMELIGRMGLQEDFDAYMDQMLQQLVEKRKAKVREEHGQPTGETIIKGLWNE